MSQITILGIFHKRNISSDFQIQQPALLTSIFGIHSQHIKYIPGKSGQQVFIGDQFAPAVGFFQYILSKLQGKQAQFFGQLTINGFVTI